MSTMSVQECFDGGRNGLQIGDKTVGSIIIKLYSGGFWHIPKMLAYLLPVLLSSLTVAAGISIPDRELTRNEYLQTVQKIRCGVACRPIGVVECGYDTEEENESPANECFAPSIEYTPRESCWTAKIRCEPCGRPVQLRLDVEDTTFIQAVSINASRPLQMTLVCNNNGRYVTRLGRPLDGVYCFAPKLEEEGSGDGSVTP